MPGPAPKPNAVRRRSHAPTFDWVHLPADGRTQPAPPVPGWHDFTPAAIEEWHRWWATPWATQWREDDPSLGRLLYIFDLIVRGQANGALMSEARQIEDRQGFSPKARLALRWLIVDSDAEVVEFAPANRRRLRVT